MSTTTTDPLEALAELLTPAGQANPYPIYDVLRAHGPVIDLGAQAIVLGYDECSRALREPRLLSMDAAVQDDLRPGWREHSAWRGLTQIMLFANNPAHDRMREVFANSFTSVAVAGMQSVVERYVAADLDRLAELGADGNPVDFLGELAFRFPMNVLGELLGIPEEDRPAFRKPVGDLATAYEPTMTLDDLDEADAGMDFMGAYLADLVAARQAEPTDDLTSAFVAAQRDGAEISDAELVANIMLLIVGGTEAPMDLLAKAVRIGIQHPGDAEGLRSGSADFAARYVEETLRFDPAVHALVRVADVDVELPGLTVAKGTRLTLITAAGNRDPRRFERPNTFDPTRPGLGQLTFSAGGHYCLGRALARMQAELLLPEVFRRFPDIRLAGEPRFRKTLIQHGYATFDVTLG